MTSPGPTLSPAGPPGALDEPVLAQSGPAVVSGRWGDYWVYVVGPLLGSSVVAALWQLPDVGTLTAKGYHDPSYLSTLASQLPVKLAVHAK